MHLVSQTCPCLPALVRYVAAMNTPGAGRTDIPNRLKRQFAIFHVPPPSEAAINNIFGSLMAGRFDAQTFSPEVGSCGKQGQDAAWLCEVSPVNFLLGHACHFSSVCLNGKAKHCLIFQSLLPTRPCPFLQVVDLAARLVPLTMTLWNHVQAKLLPTPAKFHYLFNMRDLSKVFQGILLAHRDRFAKPGVLETAAGTPKGYGGAVTSPEGYLLALWVHECQRVFADKLISHQDKAWVEATVMDLAKQVGCEGSVGRWGVVGAGWVSAVNWLCCATAAKRRAG